MWGRYLIDGFVVIFEDPMAIMCKRCTLPIKDDNKPERAIGFHTSCAGLVIDELRGRLAQLTIQNDGLRERIVAAEGAVAAAREQSQLVGSVLGTSPGAYVPNPPQAQRMYGRGANAEQSRLVSRITEALRTVRARFPIMAPSVKEMVDRIAADVENNPRGLTERQMTALVDLTQRPKDDPKTTGIVPKPPQEPEDPLKATERRFGNIELD